jgi:uncharacterized metal-binding protein
MPDLPQRKVGIVACSGEELSEGTVSRLAALKVLEELRPADTVTICLPLFLAGGEGDRAFARFYPTITLDGCALRCAARGTEQYSGKPAVSLVVNELCAAAGLEQPAGRRQLDAAGQRAVDLTAERTVQAVDELLGKSWSRRSGEFLESLAADPGLPVLGDNPAASSAAAAQTAPAPVAEVATCACGSGIPVQTVEVAGEQVTMVALPLIFAQQYADGKRPQNLEPGALLELVRIYNPLPAEAEAAYRQSIAAAYAVYCASQEADG